MQIFKRVLLLLIVILFALIGMWIVQDNAGLTAFSLFGFDLGEQQVGVLVLFSFMGGTVAGLVVSLIPLLKSKLALRQCKKQLLAARLVLNRRSHKLSSPPTK